MQSPTKTKLYCTTNLCLTHVSTYCNKNKSIPYNLNKVNNINEIKNTLFNCTYTFVKKNIVFNIGGSLI